MIDLLLYLLNASYINLLSVLPKLDDLKPSSFSAFFLYIMLRSDKVNHNIYLQMLPWENLPILRNQEVYRMPSIGSIFATLDRYCENQETIDTSIPVFPLIDPLDSYYLLNPDGDLSRTQGEFENWFKNQNIEVT